MKGKEPLYEKTVSICPAICYTNTFSVVILFNLKAASIGNPAAVRCFDIEKAFHNTLPIGNDLKGT